MASRRRGPGQPERAPFTRFSQWVSTEAGRPVTFAGAVGLIVLWAVLGPLVGFSDSWQLIINTSTTIITFLMVFVIQNSQNREIAALHIKIDELIACTKGTHRVLLDLEELDDNVLESIRRDYEALAREERDNGKALAREERDNGKARPPAPAAGEAKG